MAKVIEFIGASGIGKTTTYKRLLQIHRNNNLWTPYDKCKFPTSNYSKKIRALFSKFLSKKYEMWVDPQLKKTATDNFISENPAFINNLWDSVYNLDKSTFKTDPRFNALSMMMSFCAKYQLIKGYQISKYCLLDEGLIHNIYLTIANNVNYKDQLNESIGLISNYLGAIFYFQANSDVILQRIESRFSDRFLSHNQIIHRMELNSRDKPITIEILKRRKIPVFIINAENNVSDNAARIKDCLKSL